MAIIDAKAVILQAIADERAQVMAKIDALNVQLAELQAKLDAGEVLTPADLAVIVAAVNGIFEPPQA